MYDRGVFKALSNINDYTAQKIKFSIRDFPSKCDFIFCAVLGLSVEIIYRLKAINYFCKNTGP